MSGDARFTTEKQGKLLRYTVTVTIRILSIKNAVPIVIKVTISPRRVILIIIDPVIVIICVTGVTNTVPVGVYRLLGI